MNSTFGSNAPLQSHGYEIHRRVFGSSEIAPLCREADRVAQETNSANVRRLTARSTVFAELARSSQLAALLPPGLTLVRSILFDKTPEENWPVAWHQDLTIAVTRKEAIPGYGPWSCKDGVVHVQPPVELLRNMSSLRIHLDETPRTNGALWVLPGTHRLGKIPSGQVAEYGGEAEVICECGPGDVLLMSPLILHASRRSEIPGRRRVIHFEYARREDLDSRLGWYE